MTTVETAVDTSSVDPEKYRKALETFRQSPAGFATRVLGITPQLHQVEILNSVRDNRRTLVISCNSIGKDFIAAVATHWWLQIWEEALVITTAPTGEQVKNIQWKEIRHQYLNSKEPLGGNMPDIEPVYRLGSKRMAFGISTKDESERLAGHHEAHILIVITEGSAVADETYEGLRSLMASGDVHILVLTNPTRNSGETWEIAQGNRAGWNTIWVSGWDLPNLKACQKLGPEHMAKSVEQLEEDRDCPNPTPYLLTHVFEAECASDFGVDSDYYAIHVAGVHGKSGKDSLIPGEWVDLAFERDPELTGKRGGGLDIARSGNDHSCYAEVNGNAIVKLTEMSKMEVTQTEGWMRQNVLNESPDLCVCIDDTGLGGGVAPHLAEDFRYITGIDFSQAADDSTKYANKPSEMYFYLRKRLDPDGENPLSFAMVPGSVRKRLRQQLTKPTFKTDDSKGRIKVDKKGGGSESPDMGDAIILSLEAQQAFVWSGLSIDSGPRYDPMTPESDREGLAEFAGIGGKRF